MKKTVLASALALVLATESASALDVRDVRSPTGDTMFTIRFHDAGEVFEDDDEQPQRSSRTLTDGQKADILRGVKGWAERIRATPGARPAVINVGTIDDANASASGPLLGTGKQSSMTALQLVLGNQLNAQQDAALKAAGDLTISVGTFDFAEGNRLPSQLPASDKMDLVATIFHEMAHGLGISTDTNGDAETGEPFPVRLGDSPNPWMRGLRDDNGNAGQPGAPILCDGCDNAFDENGFDVRNDQGHFVGKSVNEVLQGALPGVPVRMQQEDLLGELSVDTDMMSHLELKNGLMSHQDYRNYTTFMEAELAVLQDLGYDIDRRRFFGGSIYGDDQALVNKKGYGARNAQGTAYIPGRYSATELGLGLHVYGSRNTISQQADLLTRGAGAAGIRVDGGANALTIPKGTKVHADGVNGRGIMFAYGKDHSLAVAGDVQAMGEQGIGVSFDFGNNAMGNAENYRGSHINTAHGQNLPVPDDINGALLSDFDLTGRVAGKRHAIYMSPNALVDRINIMQGARVEGSIRSDYTERDAAGQPRLTRITFGEAADASGRSTGKADASFNWRHDGDITGRNIVLAPTAGLTSLNGTHSVHSVQVAPGATLAGNGTYAVDPGQTFLNQGTVSPGHSIGDMRIDGDYRQTESGTLRIEVDGTRHADTLTVSGRAQLAGQLRVVPQADWYGEDWTLSGNQILKAGTVEGAFDRVAVALDSPTLTASVQAGEAGRAGLPTLRIGREANAYSQHGNDADAASAGRALNRLAVHATGDARTLLKTLDFSAPDGSTVSQALDQLTPSGYSAMTASSLARQRQVSGLIADRALRPAGAHEAGRGSGWTSFATPFGGGRWQDRRGSIVGFTAKTYGVLAGAEKRSETHPDWVFGGFGAIGQDSVSIRAPYTGSGRTTAFSLGLHARYARSDSFGPYAFGQIQVGTEDGKFDRRVTLPGYSAKNSGKWTGWTTGATLGGGYRWALNEAVHVGPVAEVSYARLSRVGLTEMGASATRLKLGAAGFDSLRTRLGVAMGADFPLAGTQQLRADLQLTWDRELLDRHARTRARFADDATARLSSRNAIGARDALGLRAGLTYQVKQHVTLGAGISSQFFLSGQRAVNGDVSLNWRF